MTLRQTVLDVCNEFKGRGPGLFQAGHVLGAIQNRLKTRTLEDQQALLTVWSDLFRQGILAWGYDLSNIEPPFMHLTAVGRRTLSQLSRDPYNPDGYLAAVRPHLTSEPVAFSYIQEAVQAFQAGCYKSAAVMVGSAAESLVLSVRDTLVTRLNTLGTAVPAQVNDWRVKTVRDAVEREIDNRRTQLDRKLYERFSGFWMSISDQMRLVRNDAGHPISIDPVTHDLVHGNLLLYPAFAELVKDLNPWIATALS
jgi:hypothetical protein